MSSLPAKRARMLSICRSLSGDQVQMVRAEIFDYPDSVGRWVLCTARGPIVIERDAEAGSSTWKIERPNGADPKMQLFCYQTKLDKARARSRAEMVQITRAALRRVAHPA